MRIALKHLLSWCGFVLAGLLALTAGCGNSEPVEAKLLRAEVSTLRTRIESLQTQQEHDAPRASAYRMLEFLGEQPAATGAVTTFKILAAPDVPDPKTSDYADCAVVWLCESCDENEKGQRPRMLITATVFHDRKRTSAAYFGVGSLVQAHLVPWDQMPDAAQSIQRVDENDILDHPVLAALQPTAGSIGEVIEVAALDANTPTPEQAIADSIAVFKARLAPHGSFAEWHRELDPVRAELRKQLSLRRPLAKDRRFVFRNVNYIEREPSEQWPGPQVAYFVSLRDQLAALGIDLIVAPFPEKEQVVAPQFLAAPPSDGVVDAQREQWYLSLLEAGVEVVDSRADLQAAIRNHEHVYYDAMDGHPANGAIVTVARGVARRLRRYAELKPTYATLVSRQAAYSMPEEQVKFPPHAHTEKCYSATVVTQADGSAVPLNVPDAPVLLIGDSFIFVPKWYGVPNADVGSHLTKETGLSIRRLGRGGGAPQLMVQMASAGRKLTKGVRVAVYMFREDYMFKHREDQPKYRWQVAELPK